MGVGVGVGVSVGVGVGHLVHARVHAYTVHVSCLHLVYMHNLLRLLERCCEEGRSHLHTSTRSHFTLHTCSISAALAPRLRSSRCHCSDRMHMGLGCSPPSLQSSARLAMQSARPPALLARRRSFLVCARWASIFLGAVPYTSARIALSASCASAASRLLASSASSFCSAAVPSTLQIAIAAALHSLVRLPTGERSSE